MSWLPDLLKNFFPTLLPDIASAAPPPAPQEMNPDLHGPFRYLIAVDDQIEGKEGEIFEMGLHGVRPKRGKFFLYKNLLVQEDFSKYGPYVASSDTAAEYGERVLDTNGAGWQAWLRIQCEDAVRKGAIGIEWDNPDSYRLIDVMWAITYASINYKLQVIGKNPLICDWDPVLYIRHPAVTAVVVEKGCGNPKDMDDLRRKCGKPNLLVVFVAFEGGKAWIHETALLASKYSNMWCTYSPRGEYETAEDVV